MSEHHVPTQPEAEPAPPAMPTKAQIEAYRKQRVSLFLERMNALCEELECDVAAVPYLTQDGRVTAQILVQPK